MGSTWHRSVRRADWQVHVGLSRLSIHRLGLCGRHAQPHLNFHFLTLKAPTDDTMETRVDGVTPTFQRNPIITRASAHSVLGREVKQKDSSGLQAGEGRHTASTHSVYFHLALGKFSQAQQASGLNVFAPK